MRQLLRAIKHSRGLQLLLLVALSVTAFKLGRRPIKAPTTPVAFAETTAMITNMERNSGGSGVVLESNPSESLVLTNSHVCEVAKKGGMVHTETKSAIIVSFKQSEAHDLCLIKVKSDLGINTELASSAPAAFSKASVAGHPLLLPTIITDGHFSHKMVIPVLFRIKKCEQEDLEGDNAFLCMFFGGIPMIRIFEAQAVSATIQPGSSGSAVFNENGQISGLVFAGSGQLAYAFVVPHEYIKYFVEVEVNTLKETTSSLEFSPFDEIEAKRKIKSSCANAGSIPEEAKNICNIIQRDTSIY